LTERERLSKELDDLRAFKAKPIRLSNLTLEEKLIDASRSRVSYNALRNARVRKAMPAWADRKAILGLYVEAKRLTRETGMLHHVDHVYPLTSEDVCGLHVIENLQIITAYENLSKGNRLATLAKTFAERAQLQ
jgi:hypothetical protein